MSTREEAGHEMDEGIDKDLDPDVAVREDASREDMTTEDPSREDVSEDVVNAGDVSPETDEGTPSLLPEGELDEFRSRWDATQARFVDDPREAVTDADALVQELLGRLTDSFTNERQTLEEKWGGDGSEASTEDLRVALQRYRSLFGRLLAA